MRAQRGGGWVGLAWLAVLAAAPVSSAGCTVGNGGGPMRDGGMGVDGPSTGRDAAPFMSCDPSITPSDLDSDRDGMTDYEECTRTFTDPTNIDTDGDGFTDLAEIAAGTDPNDLSDRIPAEDFFVVLPYVDGHVLRELSFGTDLRVADIYFLIDTTGSMEPAIQNVQDSLSRIAAAVATSIPDVQMGVGHFEDFPFGTPPPPPFGPYPFYGSDGDDAYENFQDITADVSLVETALGRLTRPDGMGGVTSIGDGGDGNEAPVEALYQTATGAGGDWSFRSGLETYSIPRRDCPSIPDEEGVRRGYPCFRPFSLPIIVLVHDTEFHNGGDTGTRWPYTLVTPDPQNLPGAADAMNAIGARYIGIPIRSDSGMAFPSDDNSVAIMTGSVDASGAPLVFPAFAGAVSDEIIGAIDTLARVTPMDVRAEARDHTPNPGDVDATGFIKAITPLRGVGAGGGMGYTSMDETTFYGVTPGTTVIFTVDFYNDIVPTPSVAQIYQARILVIGNRSTLLDERRVFIIVPPDGGTVLI